MDFTNHPLTHTGGATVQYSDSSLNKLNNSNSTVSSIEILSSLTDLIPNPDYVPWYLSRLRKLGTACFIDFANKARAGSDTPHVLFRWMLENPSLVK